MSRRREIKVLLTLAEVRAAFEQQILLAVTDVLDIIHEAQFRMNLEPNVVSVLERASTYVMTSSILLPVFGDIHGQFYDLMQLMDAVGVTELAEKDVQLVFLGDYVDRGAFSCEVMLYLFRLKIQFTNKVFLLRGNHEYESISSFYGFRSECRGKYGISIYYHFLSCFQSMPLAALLATSRGKILCVHGGLSPELKSIQDIQVIDRRREIPTTGLLCDLLWSDPVTSKRQGMDAKVDTQVSWKPNQARGCSYYFNAAATFEFLGNNQLLSLIRAHEYDDEGFTFHFNSEEFEKLDNRDDKLMPPLITVFSAPNYCDSYGNTAAYLLFRNKPFSWEIQQVNTVGHPPPPIASAERGSDMWRLFNETLPFLPASKKFFEEVLWLAQRQRAQIGLQCAPNSSAGHDDVSNLSGVTLAENETLPERRRRMSSEMHPQAIRKVLDDEVNKWEMVEDKTQHCFPGSKTLPRIHRRPSLSSVEEKQTNERPNLLTTQELDTIKLMFSLMDTDGSLELNSAKVSQFVLNILGERISTADANSYLDALDYDRNGVVDFVDILSWIAVMKANHNNHHSSSFLSLSSLQIGARLLTREFDSTKIYLWLAFLCMLRDIIVPKQRKVIKSSYIRLLGSISLVLYILGLLSGESTGRKRVWPRLPCLRNAVMAIKQKLLWKEETDFSVEVGTRVLVGGKYAGVIRYVPKRRTALVGIELTRARGDNDGATEDGQRLFECKPLHGIFVREEQLSAFSEGDGAACVLQSIWRRYSASQKFRHLVFAHAWNLLDNTQEQLNLKRSEQFKSAEHTLAQLTKTQVVSDVAVSEIKINSTYSGPHVVWPLELSNVLAILDSFKTTQILHYKYVLEILKASVRSFSPLPTLQEISLEKDDKLTVVGDLHGQLQDLFSIFSINGLPTRTNKYLFNGDFVDRGMYGIEVMMTILLFRLLYPTSVFLNRGNHESRNQNSWMGFEDEVWMKYSGIEDDDLERPVHVFESFQTLFGSLPLCAIIQDKIFVVHGGLFSRDNVTLAHLRGISRKREPPLHQLNFQDKIFEDLLWSDPRPIQSRQPSERGAGVEFGITVTNNFCFVNKIALIIRSHECVIEGFEILHGGRLITLFSASRYCGTQMNKGAFLTFGTDLQPEIQQFYAQSITESTFQAPAQAQMQNLLEEDTLRMIAERICDHKASLYWYFTQHDDEHKGTVPRLIWAEALRSVLQLDLPFLTYQSKLAELIDETSGRINYSHFLARYRIENNAMDNCGWQESIIALICKKLYRAMGAGDVQQAFKVFDTDSSGFIEYEEFVTTLKQMDTGLADQHVYELMRTADTNDDGRIDFNEFAQRFEVIFTDQGKNREEKLSEGAAVEPSPTLEAVDAETMRESHKIVEKPIFARRVSSVDEQSAFTPQPARNLDVETMEALLQVGKALFSRPGSLQYHFCHFDTNQDGVLSHSEFKDALDHLGFNFESSLMDRVMAAVDSDGGHSIDYKEFVTAFSVQDLKEQSALESGDLTWQNSVLQQVSNVFYQHRIHIRNAFRMFDASNSGVISRDNFRTGIQAFNVVLNSPLSDDQIEELLSYLDSNNDGVISYKEFFNGFRVVDVRVDEDKSTGRRLPVESTTKD
ncbi:hypothetical protein DD238_002301 [Peronospora effusa]|uniref:Serine/threonine-protein phosphatase n=1 Tax=Peronospora effusa TaxID=542832 RepID=A0A3M6VHR6_9STRA|nr:hypothetical protein DD238_002301 [Peronospora effusa]